MLFIAVTVRAYLGTKPSFIKRRKGKAIPVTGREGP
jgi:hypothetical protein